MFSPSQGIELITALLINWWTNISIIPDENSTFELRSENTCDGISTVTYERQLGDSQSLRGIGCDENSSVFINFIEQQEKRLAEWSSYCLPCYEK